MDGDLEARADVEEAGTVTGEEEGEGHMETTPRTEQTPSAEESQTAPDLPKASEDNDDDVVLVEGPPAHSQGRVQPPSPTPAETLAAAKDCAESATTATASSKAPSPPSSAATTGTKSESEPIVIDDEEDSELKGAAASSLPPPEAEDALSSTEPDSEIKIASVTTLGTNSSVVAMATSTATPLALCAQEDINLMITNVTSLKGEAGPAAARLEGLEGTENGLQISSAFSLNPEAQQNQGAASRPSPTFNPGRISAASQPVQNGETGTHQRSDSWISQSASFPRNQKQPGVDSPSPAAPLSKPPCQSSSGSQQPQRTMKVTCANCKKPLKKGQTAYQRKGSSHLFCSTTCLSAFSHKPAPKKSCTMCKKDITNMKGGTIVAQVDSSESFQEFCSTGCLAAYENKQNPQKNQLKTKCTVCGKLTEIRHEVSFKNVTHKICSDTCFNRYRMANGLIMNCCEQCGNYLPSRATANHFLLIDGQQKRFCCQNCIRDYKQTHGKIVQCSGCKVMCRSFDATQCIGSNGAMESYCTTACMAKSKFPAAAQNSEPSCHFCKRNALPQYQAALPEGKVLSFCSSQCVTKFQNATIQTSANGQLPASASENIQLKCNYCRGSFNLKPEILEWEDKVYQFCSKTCCEDYKKLHCIVTFCEYCQEEKTLHETVKFSGVKRPFCSEGCKLLFKQDFARRLGLKCVTCNHCTQMCKKSVTKEIDGVSRDFCSETCAKKFHDWYYKAARCDCCKVQGNLMESVQWRAEMKHFCDQQCLLRFYCQQNEPNMATQKGPENTALGFGGATQASKMSFTQGPVSYTGGGILKDVKNKAVLCKPLTMTKATYCKPHMQSKPLQTDEACVEGSGKEYVPVPVPVPVYIPVPMNLYAQATPTPIAIPVPVPVPVFLPTTWQNAEQIVKTINELKAKVPSDPLEADLIAMAEVIAQEDEKPKCSNLKCEKNSREVKMEGVKHENGSGSSEEEEEEEEEDKYEPDLDLEKDLPLASEPVLVEHLDTDTLFSLPPVLSEEKEKTPRPRTRRRGQKRRAVEEESSSSLSSSPTVESSSADSTFPLISRYGLNAWRRWATSEASTSSQSKGKESHIQVSLLSLSPAELNQSLSHFVKEVRRPNGESYTPDSLLYLCLSIQKHLQDKGRTDDLFGDPQYHMFGEELNKLLTDWQPSVLPDGSRWGRVEEQYLWSSGQLGEQTPSVLLRSLLYLNTKYFVLRTTEQHLRLSFGNVYGPSSSKPHSHETTVCICIPSISQEQHEQSGSKRRRRDDCDSNCEADSGSGGSAHCPVRKHECRLYELYLSKCPESVRQRTDFLYMKPEDSASSDSPLWFSSTPLEKSALARLLTRVLLVRDIYKNNQHEEEGV
ncbi:zinc finger MYM-type protein 2-like isoform X1 [Sinocyclocheilus grahami]|uniref:Zinc finger MYM-type containing 2 n=1 Tax=Sinocyclocheilus grahami TaxID=75366 RepID=A0A672QA20_SINGR|nr:PREDICTED: zinc finger MYM-type protein 2-like isoform X1 [Sinocyclocheilus grahami]